MVLINSVIYIWYSIILANNYILDIVKICYLIKLIVACSFSLYAVPKLQGRPLVVLEATSLQGDSHYFTNKISFKYSENMLLSASII